MAGIYIHIPFCKQKCSYCDFHFSTTFSSYRYEMVDAICKEISRRKDYLNKKTLSTIYFGGGTPSLLKKEEIDLILTTIQKNFDTKNVVEITLEANPDDINEANLQSWKSIGINRLSIGIQSFKKEDLMWMNRTHSVDDSLNSVKLAQQFGFENITIDLIYGLPHLTPNEWKTHIQKAIDFGVNHISAYCLTVEKKTALHKWVQDKKIILSSEDQQSEQFLLLVKELQAVGLKQYEISNFSRPNFESQHNSNYWKGEWYLGVGPSAHSFNGTSRSWNVANNRKYLQAIKENGILLETELLSSKDQFNEYLLTGLRTIYGVQQDKLNEKHPISAEFNKKIRKFKNNEWLTVKDNTIQLTSLGKLKADFITSELFV